MGTRSIIAVRESGETKGRYVHWDGYPSHMGVELLKLVERDGLERVIEVLTREHHGWSSIDSEESGELRAPDTPDRFASVAGYGVAYTDEEQPDEWLAPFHPDNSWAAYVYVMTPMGLEVSERGKPRGVFEWHPRSMEGLKKLG